MNKNEINSALDALKVALTEDGTLTANASIAFKDNIYEKGMFWAGKSYTKQFVMASDPDRIFSSETIDVAKDKAFSINGMPVLTASELGNSVIKSNLREVGRLKGLIVDGSLSVNQYLYFDANSDRLGIGTEEPNGALSVAEDGVEIVLGTEDFAHAYIGTHQSNDFNIKTDGTTRISIKAGGDITLGDTNNPPVKVAVHGKLAIGVSNPDPDVDLHVKGSVKFNNKIQMHGTRPPQGGSYNIGDIVWNERPRQRSYIGWVCTQAGNPGIWAEFGEIR